jgi:hypothetical protein
MNDTNANCEKNSALDNVPVLVPVDEYNGAMVTLPLSKLLKIVEERVEAKTLNDNWSTKYWLLHAENEELKKKLEEMRRES